MRYLTGIDGYFIIFMIRIELNIGKYENMVNMKYGILKWPDITRTDMTTLGLIYSSGPVPNVNPARLIDVIYPCF